MRCPYFAHEIVRRELNDDGVETKTIVVRLPAECFQEDCAVWKNGECRYKGE